MSALVALRNILLADEDVAAVTTRIAPRVKQNSVLPCLTIQKISGEQDALLDYAHPRYQVTSWATTYEAADELNKKVKEALQRYRGREAGLRIEMIVFLNDTSIYEPETEREAFAADFRVDYWEE